MSSNPNKQPTAPGWWWAKVYGKECIVEVFNYHGDLAVFFTGNEVDTCIDDPTIEWLATVISHEEGKRLQDEVAELRKERDGIRAEGIRYRDELKRYTEAVWEREQTRNDPIVIPADVNDLQRRIADLEAQQAQWDGPVQSRVEAYKRHVMGAIDEVDGKKFIGASTEYKLAWLDACNEIRNKINESTKESETA
jgi:polyhydroxyalkanoate synthesis regulator phasin